LRLETYTDGMLRSLVRCIRLIGSLISDHICVYGALVAAMALLVRTFGFFIDQTQVALTYYLNLGLGVYNHVKL